ncbi:hypothetical protein P3T43_006168, partial [Paraburkholderia sp. GAS41]
TLHPGLRRNHDPLSLWHLTFNTVAFFAAAKKVSAAPHRGEVNRPLRIQGKANAIKTQPKRPQGKKNLTPY